MKYFIEDGDDNVVGKFDGRERETRPEDSIVKVETVEELSDIDVDWIDFYDS